MCSAVQHGPAPAQVSSDQVTDSSTYSGLLVRVTTYSYKRTLTYAAGKHSQDYTKACVSDNLGILQQSHYIVRDFLFPVTHRAKSGEMPAQT